MRSGPGGGNARVKLSWKLRPVVLISGAGQTDPGHQKVFADHPVSFCFVSISYGVSV